MSERARENGRPTRLCFVMPFHILEGRGGGAEVQAWFLARSYVAQSVRGNAGQEERLEGVRVIWVRPAHHVRWSNAPAYYRAMVQLDPDFVVQRMTNLMTGVIGLYCQRHGRGFAWMCTDDASPMRWAAWRAQREANRLHKAHPFKAAFFLADALLSDLSRQWGMRRVTRAFAQNRFQEEALARSFGLASRQMVSGHQPPARLIPPERRLADGIVLWVANLGPRKRPELFVELARRGNGSGLRFVMIGGRDDALYVQSLFRDAPPNLEWLGRRSFEEALAWFDRAAFFVNTSTAAGEGFPNTYVQAWLRGVPVFALEVDPDGIVTREELGRLCPDVETILADLRALAAQPGEYDRLAKSAREFATQRYTIGAAATALLKGLEA